jgi:glucose/arabinose dehydrogenase
VTIGDRGNRPSAQDRSNHNGTIIRLTRNGGIPSDNPFVNPPDIQPKIWSFGHRNPQGAALDSNGQLWTAEHGAKGGDEVNRRLKPIGLGTFRPLQMAVFGS